MPSRDTPFRFSQLTRALVSQSKSVWSFSVSWCRFVTPETDDNADRFHKHSLYELQVVTNGCINVKLNNDFQSVLSAGEFILLPPFTVHSVTFGTLDSSKFVLAFDLKDTHPVIEKALSSNLCSIHTASSSMRSTMLALRAKLAEFHELTPYIISFLLQGVVLEAINTISPVPLCVDNNVAKTLNDRRLEQANNLINSNILYPISGSELARELGISLRHLNRIYVNAYGHPVNKQIQIMRISYARNLLTSTSLSLADIAESMQYSSVYSFIRAFTNVAGISPGNYRNGTVVSKVSPIQDDSMEISDN